MFIGTLSLNSNKLTRNKHHLYFNGIYQVINIQFPMTETVLNLVTYTQWEKTQVVEYDKICNGLKALSEILSIYSYVINMYIARGSWGRTLGSKYFRNHKSSTILPISCKVCPNQMHRRALLTCSKIGQGHHSVVIYDIHIVDMILKLGL